MTTPAELKRLIELCIGDPRHEPAFLRALLDARLYVHLPMSDDSPKLRLVCFTRPDGLTVIPVFTDPTKAEVAAQGAARIAAMQGRELFRIVPGATFMLDPNDISTTLYPEEIEALLANGTATIAPATMSGTSVGLSPAPAEDHWLAERVVDVVHGIASVEAAHLMQSHVAGSLDPTNLLIVLAVPAADAERAARAVALTLAASGRQPRLPVDLATYDPSEPRPGWGAEAGLEAFWTRAGSRVHAPSGRRQ